VALPFEDAVLGVRRALGGAIFERIAGADGQAERRRLRSLDEPRWFEPGSPITVVHGDASMFIGGLSALLLQSLHPLAMAGVEQHSGFRGDPWGRLARTSRFLALTTYGTAADARRQIRTVRAVHRHVEGIAPDGRPYSAGDPHLLTWVHLCEVTSFLRAYQRYGADTLDDDAADEYVAQAGRVARELGAVDLPSTVAELHAMLDAYRPELAGTPAARETARYLALNPPVPAAARPVYLPIAAAAIGLLPVWARWPLRLPWLPITEATLGRAAGESVTRVIRWALPAAPGLSGS
jgi:uncharacterized protein (DUF2236 family)